MLFHWVWEKDCSSQSQPPVTSKYIHVFEIQLDWAGQKSIMYALISRYRCLLIPNNLLMWFYNFVLQEMCQKNESQKTICSCKITLMLCLSIAISMAQVCGEIESSHRVWMYYSPTAYISAAESRELDF